MPQKLPPHLHREISRHGRPRWYFRRGHAARVRLPDQYGSPGFWAALDAALGGPSTHKSPTSGTFAWALSLYRGSQAWGALSPATRRQCENIFIKIVKRHGDSPIAAWKRGDIAAGRDKRAATPAAARHFVEALRGLFKWMVESSLVAADPTVGVTIVKPKSEGFSVWTPEDEALFRSRWPLGTRERVAFEILRQAGLLAATPYGSGARMRATASSG